MSATAEGWAAFERACGRVERTVRRAARRGAALGHDERYRLRGAYHAQELQPAADAGEALRRAAYAVERATRGDELARWAWRAYCTAWRTADRADAAIDLACLCQHRPALREAWERHQAVWRIVDAAQRPARVAA